MTAESVFNSKIEENSENCGLWVLSSSCSCCLLASFYVSQFLPSAQVASLLTSCYPPVFADTGPCNLLLLTFSGCGRLALPYCPPASVTTKNYPQSDRLATLSNSACVSHWPHVGKAVGGWVLWTVGQSVCLRVSRQYHGRGAIAD